MSKPFNLADAKAGHPVGTRDGHTASILKFDSPLGDTPLVGLVGRTEIFSRWTAAGEHYETRNEFDLVMAPIGTINDKPVYPGDMITTGGHVQAARHGLPFPSDAAWPPAHVPTLSTVSLENGKYTVQHNNGTDFKALRYGEPWRDLTGDGLALAMAQRIEELESVLLGIAAYGDAGANDYLASTGKYSRFDEPDAVQAARYGLGDRP